MDEGWLDMMSEADKGRSQVVEVGGRERYL